MAAGLLHWTCVCEDGGARNIVARIKHVAYRWGAWSWEEVEVGDGWGKESARGEHVCVQSAANEYHEWYHSSSDARRSSTVQHPPALSSSLLHRLRSSVVGFWLLRMNTRHHVDHCETHLNPEAMVAASKVWVHKCARPQDKRRHGRRANKQLWECVDPTQQTSNSHRVDVFVMGGLPTRGQLPRRKRHSARWLFVLQKKPDNQRTMYCNWVWRCLRSDKHGTKGSTKPCSTQRWRTDQARAFKIALTYANSERNFPLSACCRQKLRYFARLVLAHRVADGKAGELYEPACCKNHLSSIWCA